MTLPRESVLALQRHFLGVLSVPAHTTLEPRHDTQLALIGDAIRTDGDDWLLDFGVVDSSNAARSTLRVVSAGELARVRCIDTPRWLRFSSSDSGYEVLASHEGEGEHHAALTLTIAGARTSTLNVRLVTQTQKPLGDFQFNGALIPSRFDFDPEGHPYEIIARSANSAPLVVTFADLPSWLTFEIDGYPRKGPITGSFFRRVTPFTVRLRPHAIGQHDGVVRMRTNDARPEYQLIDLQFTGALTPERPHVRAFAPKPLRGRSDQSLMTLVRLENWGRTPAIVSCRTPPAGITVGKIPAIPAWRDGNPGGDTLPIGVTTSHLSIGVNDLLLCLQVGGGEPAEVRVPVRIDVLPSIAPAVPNGIRLQTAVVLIVLLLLTFVLVIATRGLS
jgi:hypothetical protein